MVDAETVRNVELLGPLLGVGGGGAASGGGNGRWGGRRVNNSLFGLLNHCATPGGVRHLRASLYQPPVRQDIIQRRLDAIQVLCGHRHRSYIALRAINCDQHLLHFRMEF